MPVTGVVARLPTLSGVDRRGARAEVIAHRGASAYALEHSLAAFDLALDQGADALELDVRLTADGQPVVIHDPTLLRTAADARAVAAVSACDLASLDPAVRPPMLADVLDRYGAATRWFVELKDTTPLCVDAVATALATRGLGRYAVVQSFDSGALRRMRGAMPSLAVAPLLWRAPGARRLRSIATFATGIGVRYACVDLTLLMRARADGLAVRAWTPNATEDIARLAELGVDGVITDVPDRARSVVDDVALRDAA